MQSKSVAVRLIATCFALLCLYQAAAGLFFYRGKLAFANQEYPGAITNLNLSLRMTKQGEAFTFLGASRLKIDQTKGSVIEARKNFEKAIALEPYSAKNFILLAGTYTFVAEEISPETWRFVRGYLLKAIQMEPGNAWGHYEAGRIHLVFEKYLTREDKQTAIFLLRKSLEIRLSKSYSSYLEEPSIFVRAALNLIWNSSRDFSRVMAVVPEEFTSYRALMAWIDQKALWAYRAEVHRTYLNLRNAYYDEQCGLGEKFLRDNRPQEALDSFKKAYWASDWTFSRAKAGILIAEAQLRVEGSFFGDKQHEVFRDVVMDESLPLPMLKGLSKAVHKTQSPFLSALYKARMGDCGSADNQLSPEGVMDVKVRRFLAICYKNKEQYPEAENILKPVLSEEMPDLKDLLLLKELLPLKQSEIDEKIIHHETLRLPSKAWWGDGGFSASLSSEGKRNISLNLRSGKVKIKVLFRSALPQQSSYLTFRIDQKEVGGSAVTATHWQMAELDFETDGGIHWVTAELLNPGIINNKTAKVALGAVSVSYLRD